jgi:mRNA-degrading endonuclease YafQ of YafQ-DinJ toxin-antitoxin module
MRILYSAKFARQYKKVPKEIKERAEKAEALFRENPFDPQLKTHRLSGPLDGFYAFSINHSYRIIFDLPHRDLARFYAVGDHSIYD